MQKSGKKTLLWSVFMSSAGPIVVGAGLIVGQSSTQLADFIRRSAELLGIILSFINYCITTEDNHVNEEKKKKLEKASNIFVSITMILSGVIMMILAVALRNEEKGNVVPGLLIAILGATANFFFWIRYTKLGKKENNNILKIQSKLYRAKTFVDTSVTIALFSMLISKNSVVSNYFDLIGTCIVSLYLIYTGISSLIKEIKNK